MWPVWVPPPPPLPDRSQEVLRHLGQRCGCTLLDCCHNEMPEDGCDFTPGHGSGYHVDSGSPASGGLYPFTEKEWEAWNGRNHDGHQVV